MARLIDYVKECFVFVVFFTQRTSTFPKDSEVFCAFLTADPYRVAKMDIFDNHAKRIQLAQELRDLFVQHEFEENCFNVAMWAAIHVAPLKSLERIRDGLKSGLESREELEFTVASTDVHAPKLPGLLKYCKCLSQQPLGGPQLSETQF